MRLAAAIGQICVEAEPALGSRQQMSTTDAAAGLAHGVGAARV